MDDQLNELIKPVVEALGCELWGIEQFSRGSNSMLRIYIDAANGINVDDCARVSRQVSSLLDVEDPISGHYTLEVSSPGTERKLFRLEHFSRYVGFPVKIRLKRPYEGRRRFSGLLRGVEGDEVVLEQDEEAFQFPYEEIEKASIVSDTVGQGVSSDEAGL